MDLADEKCPSKEKEVRMKCNMVEMMGSDDLNC